MTDEELVKAYWLDAWLENHAECCGGVPFTVSIHGRMTGWHDTEAEAWSAAAEFTRDRLEQIRQLKYEISLLRLIHRNMVNTPANYRNPHDHDADQDALARVVIRLEAELRELQQGMKEEGNG